MNLSNFKPLIKSEDFHLYSVVQNKRTHLLLKVMCDSVLYDTELLVIQRLDAFLRNEPNKSFTLRLKDKVHFTQNTLDTLQSTNNELVDEYSYFLFETCRSNLF
jgi:hypothetical protein